ncbi:hypothetical protein PK98_06110 [Croceibacterium mercuriale]|uniref:Uncharacterized protein n=1 Tax=Croceibacterium mercuriale TaxID=1572751 RepID=A0A0B2C251_9SPHN|nr:hypothetical protein [Croceibacterium mercuriale]KHL26096.1 hypothetical protein PK98_06110 [Croceibacterium mercuriale]
MADFYRPRAYYSTRKNGEHAVSLDLDDLREILLSAYSYFETSGYLVDAFGYNCVDSGYEPGYVGSDIGIFIRLTLFRKDLWPLIENYRFYTEDDCFTMIEFIYDHVSKPHEKNYHDWDHCGYHFSKFNKQDGREEFRARFALPLERYGHGWELTEAGEIMSLPPTGMNTLVTATLPTKDETVQTRVANATARFRRHGTTLEEREVAVRDLAAVLEWLRPQIKEVLLREDESELFNIANNFGIRHLNNKQKMNYDKAVWLSWIFYHYLNTINAALHIIKRQEDRANK